MEASESGRGIAWTERQRQILDLLVRGHTNGEIAEALGISLDGVKWHVSQILLKLDVSSREEAAEYWRSYNGLPRRFARVFRALTAGAGLRWAAMAAAGAASAMVVMLAVGTAINPDADTARESRDGLASVALSPSNLSPTVEQTSALAETKIAVMRPEELSLPGPQTGSCFGPAIAAPGRPDAFRCSLANLIYDPCFLVAGGLLACEVNPEAQSAAVAILADLSGVRRNQGDWSSPAGWLVRLADGAACQPVTGATGSVGGQPATYRCSDERWILGDLKVGPVWLAEVFDPASPSQRRIAVDTVWR